MASCSLEGRLLNVLTDIGVIADPSNPTILDNTKFVRAARNHTIAAMKEYGITNNNELLYTQQDINGVMTLSFNQKLLNQIDAVINARIAKDPSVARVEWNNLAQHMNTYYQGQIPLPTADTIVTVNKANFLSYINEMIKQLTGRIRQLQSELNLTTDDTRKQEIITELYSLTTRLGGIRDNKGLTGTRTLLRTKDKDYMFSTLGAILVDDIKRLGSLVDSTSSEDIAEANKILSFLNAVTTFSKGENNPLFDDDVVFDKNGKNILPQEVIDDMNTLRQSYQPYADKLKASEEAQLTQIANDDAIITATFGNVTYQDLYPDKGMLDIRLWDAWLLDPSNSLTREVGLVPQLMVKLLNERISFYQNEARHRITRAEQLKKDVERILEQKGKGLKWQFFNAFNKSGLVTDKLVQRFSMTYYDAVDRINSNFDDAMKRANKEASQARRSTIITRAYEARERHADLVGLRVDSEMLFDPSDFTASEQKVLGIGKRTISPADRAAHIVKLKAEVGEKGFIELKAKQKTLLKEFVMKRQAYQQSQAIKKSEVDPSIDIDAKLDAYDKVNNPLLVNEYLNNKTVSSIPYNVDVVQHVARKQGYVFNGQRITEAEAATRPPGSVTTIETNFYDENFKTIEDDATLKEYYDIIQQTQQEYHTVVPSDKIQTTSSMSLMYLEKSFSEVMGDKNLDFAAKISLAYRQLLLWLKRIFAENHRTSRAYANKNVVTGMFDHEVNPEMYSSHDKKINKHVQEHLIVLKQLFGKKITSRLGMKDLATNPEVVKYLCELIGIPDSLVGLMNHIGASSSTVNMEQTIRAIMTHKHVMQASVDLPRILDAYNRHLAVYKARRDVLPTLTLMKDHFERVKDIKGSNAGTPLRSDGRDVAYGQRDNAVNQMRSWFNRAVLGNYEREKSATKQDAPAGKGNILSKKYTEWRKKEGRHSAGDEAMEEAAFAMFPNRNNLGRLISKTEANATNELEQMLFFVQEEMNTETDADNLARLKNLQESIVDRINNIGYVVSFTSVVNGMLKMLRIRALGWNLKSATVNFFEGQISNHINSFTGVYFSPDSLARANSFMKYILMNNLTLKKKQFDESTKVRALMSKFQVLQDASNILQESSKHSGYSKTTSKLDPFLATQATEYVNQFPVFLAIMMETKITDKNGNVSNLFDALDNEGNLKDDFKTAENKKSWVDHNSQEFSAFKSKVGKAIVALHGDYDEFRGNMASEFLVGKTFQMFKRWMSRLIFNRFHSDQFDLELGGKTKGRYRSLNKTTGLMAGLTLGVLFGPMVGVLTGVAGLGLALANKTEMTGNSSVLKTIMDVPIMFISSMLAFPVNLLSQLTVGKRLIKVEQISNQKDNYVNAIDFNNYIACMNEVAMITSLALVALIANSLSKSDDDPDDDKLLNVIANLSNQMHRQAHSMYNPYQAAKDYANVPIISDLKNYYTLVTNIDHAFEFVGVRVDGENKFVKAGTKLITPTALKGKALGFASPMKGMRKQDESYYAPYFASDKAKADDYIKKTRAHIKKKLTSEYGDGAEEKIKEFSKVMRKKAGEDSVSFAKRMKGINEKNYLMYKAPKQGKFSAGSKKKKSSTKRKRSTRTRISVSMPIDLSE